MKVELGANRFVKLVGILMGPGKAMVGPMINLISAYHSDSLATN